MVGSFSYCAQRRSSSKRCASGSGRASGFRIEAINSSANSNRSKSVSCSKFGISVTLMPLTLPQQHRMPSRIPQNVDFSQFTDIDPEGTLERTTYPAKYLSLVTGCYVLGRTLLGNLGILTDACDLPEGRVM